MKLNGYSQTGNPPLVYLRQSPLKRGIVTLLGVVAVGLLTGCGKSKVQLDTAALTPLINARHTADNAVRSLKELYCDPQQAQATGEISESERVCRQARLKYNRAATSINTVLSQLTLAIESNSDVSNDRVFKRELEKSVTSAFELEEFLEQTLARPSILPKLPLPFGLSGLIDTLLSALPRFSASASKADSGQKAFMVCELKALKLQPFDQLKEETKSSNCSDLLEK